jgi:hypothetical protein
MPKQIKEETLMSEQDSRPGNQGNTIEAQVIRGESNEPHHMSGLTDSAINPGPVLKSDVDLPTDTRFTVKKDFGASQIVSTESDRSTSDAIYREDELKNSEMISSHADRVQDQVVTSGATEFKSGVAFSQNLEGSGSDVVQAGEAEPMSDYAVTEGERPPAEPIELTPEQLQAQTQARVNDMLEEAKRRGEDMELVMKKAEQMMNRVKQLSEAMKVDDSLKERIRQTMLRTHQLRRRVTTTD